MSEETPPQRIDHGALEGARLGVARSEHWPAVEKAFRDAHPTCAACADPEVPRGAVQVHHINPFHYCLDPGIGRPDLELDPRNLISLCETEASEVEQNHHLDIGHLGNFKEGNLLVAQDAAGRYHGMTSVDIQKDADWLTEERVGRLKPLDEMSPAEKQAFRARLDQELPPDAAILEKYGIVVVTLHPLV